MCLQRWNFTGPSGHFDSLNISQAISVSGKVVFASDLVMGMFSATQWVESLLAWRGVEKIF